MTFTRAQRISLSTTALLFSTLACRAATRLIIPDTPIPDTPMPKPTATALPVFTPTLSQTPTLVFQASCPLLNSEILDKSISYEGNSEEIMEEEIYLVTYSLNGDTLGDPYFESVPEHLEDEQKDRATHQAIYEYFTRLIPYNERDFVDGFSIFTDGSGNFLAAVTPSENDPKEWILDVDILDSSDNYVLTFTLLHEFGHLLTLNSRQVPPSIPVFKNPSNDKIYEQEVSACPQYFTGEGCSNADSYINEFFNRFWTRLYDEWQVIDLEEDEDTYYNMLDDFYDTYEDQFVTDYAPTSPAEDIAESWVFFILLPQPELNSIANEKILFFYEYPELVALRQEILTRLCVEFPY